MKPGGRAIVFAATLLATWPTWKWGLTRYSDGSDDGYPIVAAALCALVVFLRARDTVEQRPVKFGVLPVLLLTVYGASLLPALVTLPPLVRGVVGVTLLVTVVSRLWLDRRLDPGVWALALLGLPVIASLQFYAGYPLRLVSAEIADALVSGAGLDCIREGVTLWIAGEPVAVDAPCSGIRMLWSASFVAALLLARSGATWSTSLRAGALTLLLVLLGNGLRTAALVLVEHRGLAESVAHDGVGLTAFAVAALGVALYVRWEVRRCSRATLFSS